MELKHDSSGFLVGERLGAEDITGRLDAIRDEIKALRRDLSETRTGAGPQAPSANRADSAGGTRSVSPERAERRPGADSPQGDVVVQVDSPTITVTPPGREEPGSHTHSSNEAETVTVKGSERDGSAKAQSPPDVPEQVAATAVRPAEADDPGAASSAITPQDGRDSSGRFVARSATASPGRDLSETRTGAGPQAPSANRADSAGGTRSVSPERAERRPGADSPQGDGGRGSDGRFVASTTSDPSAGSDEDSLLLRSINGLGDRVAGAAKEIGAGSEEADPSVKAFNEVAQPLSRGFSKVMGSGGGGDRKKERWYRRFFMMMRGSRREDREEGKQQKRLLKNIERKPTGGDGGSMLWRGIMLLLAPITGMLALLGGLPIALAGAVIAGLKGLLTALGLGALARRMIIPGSGRTTSQRGGSGQVGRAAARVGVAGATAGQSGSPSRSGGDATPSRSGRIAGALRAGSRRIPGVGALLGLGFMASGVAASEGGDGTRAEKDATTGRAIGGGLGSIGGMAGGAAAGAAIGTAVPVIGTAIGGIVGAIAGGYFGGNAGEDVGEKAGEWITDLRKSNLVLSLSRRWEYATSFMSSLWSQASEGMAERWEYVSTFASSRWSEASEGVSARWDVAAETAQDLWGRSTTRFNSVWESLSGSLSERWASATDEMKGVWSGAVSIASEGWAALADAAGGVNDWIAEKTGVDVGQAARDAGVWVSDRATESTEWVAGHAEDAAGRVEGATAWLGGKIAEGASWVGEKSGVAAAVNAVKSAHSEASATPALTQAMADAGITDANEQAAFMGQMHHESGGFRTMEESFNYSSADRIMAVSRTARNQGPEAVEAAMAQGPEAIAELMYGGRMGNTEPGDGHRYRGRGFTQLTGKDNYTAASKDLGIDLVNNPDMAAEPEVAAKVATWYWQNRKGLSEAAQQGDTREVTRLINGGDNGLADREASTQGYLAAAQAGEFTVSPRREDRETVPGAALGDNATSPQQMADAVTVNDASASTSPSPGATHDAQQQTNATTVRTGHLHAMGLTGARGPALGASAPQPLSIPPLSAPPINEAPAVSAPLASTSGRSSNQHPAREPQDVSRDVGDRRIAHIVTGAYSGMT